MKEITDPCLVFQKVLDHEGGAKEQHEYNPAGEVWLHLDYSVGDVQSVLHELDLSEAVIAGLTRIDTRPSTQLMDKGVLVVVRGVNTNPGADPEDMVSLRIWLEEGRLITVRQRRLLSVQDIRESLENRIGPKNIVECFDTLMETLANRIAGFVDQIEERVDKLEELIETGKLSNTRVEVGKLRRQTAVVRRYLAPQREALGMLATRPPAKLFDEDSVAHLREQYDRMLRYVEDLDLVREKILVVQEEISIRIAENQNSRVYVLSLVAAIFLPITFISGVFGMNVAGLPGVEDPTAFGLVMGVMIVITIGIVAYFKSNRWL